MSLLDEGNQSRAAARPQRHGASVQENMEILDSSEQFLHWDRNLSELSEAEEIDCVLYTNVSYRSVMEGGGKEKCE